MSINTTRPERDYRLWNALLDTDWDRRDGAARAIRALGLDEWYAHQLLESMSQLPLKQRPFAGEALSLLGDPRFSPPYYLGEMIGIPPGRVTIGNNQYRDEQPVHQVDVAAFALCQVPVTQAAYAQFVKAARYHAPRGWRSNRPLPETQNAPVTWVSARDAEAYCRWLSKETGYHYRLPTEAEWTLAARGIESTRAYPWGSTYEAGRSNSYDDPPIGRLCAVGLFREGRGPYGHDDLIGNVWEWCSSLAWAYPYDVSDGREDPASDGARVMRGGSWRSRPFSARCDSRQGEPPDDRFEVVGFRVARTS